MTKRRLQRPALGILPKVLLAFLVLALIPLIILGVLADKNLTEVGREAARRAEEMGAQNLASAKAIGLEAIQDSVRALDHKATEAIELRTVELAQRIADFLKERDQDILMLAAMEPDAQRYLEIYHQCRREVIVTDPWPPLQEDKPAAAPVISRNPENQESWRHRPPSDFKTMVKPLYKEITFVDLKGRETIKIADGKISHDLRDVSRRENTYCRAEDYFSRLGGLKKGEIYVSRVIGAYVRGWLEQTPAGITVRPGSAYAGKENPEGARFEGIIRWVTPVFDRQGRKQGYVTMALDHQHIMEFTDHVVPTEERFSAISDAGSGNYAFLWDFEDKCISHPRDFFICGYDPHTGEEVPGWISEETYREYEQSGLSLREFVKRLPPFRNFTMKKQGSRAQLAAGCISLDGRILDTAPQCEGWHQGTENGGSGSFVIFWSGLWKLTTYATVPYYTGMYGASKRGFGYVTIGANVEEFHKAANLTKANIEKSIQEQGEDIARAAGETRRMIDATSARNRRLITLITVISALSVGGAAVFISLGITRPLRRLTEGAKAMARGELHQVIEVHSRDEVGELAHSFNEMAAAVAAVDKMKSEFVTVASHELRTPIQAMLLGVSGILEGYAGQIDAETREDLMLVRDGIDRLRRLVENLLDLSRIEARKMELQMAPVRVGEVFQVAVQEVAELAAAHHHEIITRVPDDLPVIEADRDRLLQVIINLLSNAIKYTSAGGKIILWAEADDSQLTMAVADNGYGIPPWAQKDIFKKFFQADSIMSHKVGGSGLGLTISKGIVEEHGGRIYCVSPIPAGLLDLPVSGERPGSIFYVQLPLFHRQPPTAG